MTFRFSAALATLSIAASLAAQQPEPPRSATPLEEGQEPPDATPDAPSAGAPEPPAPPPVPDGILPIGEIARISYAPRDRPLPTLFGETLVIVTANGAIDAYDAATGEFSWKLGLPGEALFRPQAIEGPSPRLLVASSSGHLAVVDRAKGQLVEELDLGVEIALPPLASATELALVTSAGDVLVYDRDERTERFRTAMEEPVLALAWAQELIVASGGLRTLTALDPRTGATRWRFIGRGPFRAAATIDPNGRVYTGDDLGEFYALGREAGDVKFRWSTGGAVRLSPVVEGERVYLATLGNNLYCYQAGGGAEQWRASLPGRPIFGPFRIGQRLLVVTYEGVFVEVQPDRGRLTKSWAAPGELASPPSFRIEPRPLLPVGPPATAASPIGGDPSAADEPMWFERSRVALALRNGDVLLLKHQPPVTPAAAPPTPEAGEEATPPREPTGGPPPPPPTP